MPYLVMSKVKRPVILFEKNYTINAHVAQLNRSVHFGLSVTSVRSCDRLDQLSRFVIIQ
jgi:hypothetical protein